VDPPHLTSRQERITTTKKGSITSVQAVYVPADDLTAPATTFAYLDATTVLSCSITELGIYPAIDPLDSKSRMLDSRKGRQVDPVLGLPYHHLEDKIIYVTLPRIRVVKDSLYTLSDER
jgi:hypothetical protein